MQQWVRCSKTFHYAHNFPRWGSPFNIHPPPPPVCSPVHLVDIWNVIEAFRENGINTMDLNADLSVARLEMVLSTIFYQLNKRMPTTHQINVEQSISLLLNFLLAAYDPWVTCHLTDAGWLCALTSLSFWRAPVQREVEWKYRLFTTVMSQHVPTEFAQRAKR